ncbi:hypothetical protein DFJ73DRAFT_633786 [Zopfochytrium polystomum]|nr:hypothetical protein DFJ73DRAFT_633786 [Zopfochytrium polystomum]
MVAAGFRRVALSEREERWMAEDEILHLIRQRVRFMDVTDRDADLAEASTVVKSFAVKKGHPTAPTQQAIVAPIAANVSVDALTTWLTMLTTSFKTRYFQTESGANASNWILSQALAVAKGSTSEVMVNVRQFEHPWTQSSVIARIEAKDAVAGRSAPLVVVSAHLDSVNMWNPTNGVSPGADDDGSGSATIFEAYRVLVQSGFIPKRPIEFHWYAGEEGGLLGSQKVSSKYKKDGINVAGVLHADMTGYQVPDKQEVIGVVTDLTDPPLSEFFKKLVEEYSGVEWRELQCGYPCSDHASWTQAGYASLFMFEGELPTDGSPFTHTDNDDVSHISFDHMARFSRLAVAFAVEMSLYSEKEI